MGLRFRGGLGRGSEGWSLGIGGEMEWRGRGVNLFVLKVFCLYHEANDQHICGVVKN